MAKRKILVLQVMNDTAERRVVFIQEYNQLVTHDKDQLQFLMQV